VTHGFTSPEAFEGVGEDDLSDAGFSPEEAALVLERVNAYQKQST
jgi:hypothetical protein